MVFQLFQVFQPRNHAWKPLFTRKLQTNDNWYNYAKLYSIIQPHFTFATLKRQHALTYQLVVRHSVLALMGHHFRKWNIYLCINSLQWNGTTLIYSGSFWPKQYQFIKCRMQVIRHIICLFSYRSVWYVFRIGLNSYSFIRYYVKLCIFEMQAGSTVMQCDFFPLKVCLPTQPHLSSTACAPNTEPDKSNWSSACIVQLTWQLTE